MLTVVVLLPSAAPKLKRLRRLRMPIRCWRLGTVPPSAIAGRRAPSDTHPGLVGGLKPSWIAQRASFAIGSASVPAARPRHLGWLGLIRDRRT